MLTEVCDGITPGSGPYDLAFDVDGNLWFTEEAGRIGELIAGEHAATETDGGLPPDSFPIGISQGSDRTMWFGAFAGLLGRITLPPPPPPTTTTTTTVESSTGAAPTPVAVAPTFAG